MEQKYQFFHFGPFLMMTKVDISIWEEISEDIRNTVVHDKIDARGHLAGVIENEYFFSEELKEKYNLTLKPYIINYVKKLVTDWHGYSAEQIGDPEHKIGKMLPYIHNIELMSLWANLQRKTEYNPMHAHSGDISFVLYVNVPEEIYDEESVRNGEGNGVIYFADGLDNRTDEQLLSEESNVLRQSLSPRRLSPSFRPVNGDLLIFPADLHHSVASFQSDVTRITVSGNWLLA